MESPSAWFERIVARTSTNPCGLMLDETYFAWIGDTAKAPFYYKLHSPVILIEFDHHPGIFLDNDEAEPFHVHTIVRTPNGGDYGFGLLQRA